MGRFFFFFFDVGVGGREVVAQGLSRQENELGFPIFTKNLAFSQIV